MMRARRKKLTDYGISPERGRELYYICRHGTDRQIILLSQAAITTCHGAILAQKVVDSLVHGRSYDALTREGYVPIGKNDFYAYRRKTLALFDDYLKGVKHEH